MKALISAHTRHWGAWTWVAYLEDGRMFEDGRADNLALTLRRAGVDGIAIGHSCDTQPLSPRLRHAIQDAWERSARNTKVDTREA